MKKLAIVLLFPLLTGCPLWPTLPDQDLAVPSSLSDVGKEAAKIINEMKVDLIALNNTITNQVSQQLMSKADAQYLAAKADETWDKIKGAQALLANGQDLAAKTAAQLTQTLLLDLQKQAAQRSKK